MEVGHLFEMEAGQLFEMGAVHFIVMTAGRALSGIT